MPSNAAFTVDEATSSQDLVASDEAPTQDSTPQAEKSSPRRSIDVGTSTTNIIIDTSEPRPIDDPDCCCSWNRLCDVFGTRQATYITQLRPVRGYLIKMQESLKILQCELERNIKTKETMRATFGHVHTSILEINHLTSHHDLNIPPDENSMLRSVVYELVVLARVVEELTKSAKLDDKSTKPRSSSHITLIAEPVMRKNSEGEVTRDVGSGSSAPPVDERSLKERITRICEMTERLIRYIDRKTERRWWLRDVINFMQVAVKVALFISASISVAYHKEQIAPIITLIITIIQGIVEVLDQYFLKNTRPEDIHLSVLTTITANAKP